MRSFESPCLGEVAKWRKVLKKKAKSKETTSERRKNALSLDALSGSLSL